MCSGGHCVWTFVHLSNKIMVFVNKCTTVNVPNMRVECVVYYSAYITDVTTEMKTMTSAVPVATNTLATGA